MKNHLNLSSSNHQRRCRMLTGSAAFFLVACSALFAQPSPDVDLGENKWQRQPFQDGYMLGNGNLYVIGGLGKELSRSGKSALTGQAVSRTQLAWVGGPTYTVGNLGYGWEIKPYLDAKPMEMEEKEWASDLPSDNYAPTYALNSWENDLNISLMDVLAPIGVPVLMRHVQVFKPESSAPGNVSLKLPIHADPRNGVYAMFDGSEVNAEQVKKWRRLCGEYLKPRASVAPERMKQVFPAQNAIVLVGAARALFQEISTLVPDDKTYPEIFQERALATTAVSNDPGTVISVNAEGIQIDLGEMQPGDERTVAVWIATVSGKSGETEKAALQLLDDWKNVSVEEFIGMVDLKMKEDDYPVLLVNENADLIFPPAILQPLHLARACQSAAGGVLAQPYMYPMCYLRDQYGSFRLFLAAGEPERALRALNFYVGMENQEGIQNAHDAVPFPPDPTAWFPDANAKNGNHRRAEVPSYLILMARDYFQATGDLAGIEPFYPRLAYNLRIQEPSKNGILPYATDESYTNAPQTRPKYGDEMTDSHLLFIAAARFMAELADRLGKTEDAAEFQKRLQNAENQLMKRMWLPGENYFAYARDASEDPSKIDRRPAFDALLRWFWLEMGDPQDSIAQGCLAKVLSDLTNPIRVVPEHPWCTGMNLGYLLYALSRSQHPAAHRAAQLMEKYASITGLFSEYYSYQGNSLIVPEGGTMRPWESSINATAMLQYLTGLRVDLPASKIYVQPHLSQGTNAWEVKRFPVGKGGFLQLELKKENGVVSLRAGGELEQPMVLDMEFGLFGKALKSQSDWLSPKNGRQDLLGGTFELPAGNFQLTFAFQVVE